MVELYHIWCSFAVALCLMGKFTIPHSIGMYWEEQGRSRSCTSICAQALHKGLPFSVSFDWLILNLGSLDSVRIAGCYKWAEGWHPRGFVGFEQKTTSWSRHFHVGCPSRWSRNARVIWLLARPWFPPKRSRQMTGESPWSVRWMVWNGRREYTWCLGQYHVMMSAKDQIFFVNHSINNYKSVFWLIKRIKYSSDKDRY